MQPGEMIVARLSGGLSIGQYLSASDRGERIRMSVGRNREAQVPAERVILETGVEVSGRQEIEEFRMRAEALAAEIDLSEVWEVVRDESVVMNIGEIAELYWGDPPDIDRTIALILHLDQTTLHFVNKNEKFTPRSEAEVEEILTRRQRQEDAAQATASLAEHLSGGSLPDELDRLQADLLEHLKGFVVHGDDYTRSAVAKTLLEEVRKDSRDVQRLGFNLLVNAGVFAADEALELVRADIPTQFPQEALVEAEGLTLDAILDQSHRKDCTALPTLTIDDAGTEDKDDALSLETEQQPSDTGLTIYRIGIHIADGSALVPAGGPLETEADRRMATLYIPEGKFPMLPSKVSNVMGSLLPGETRAALSLFVRVTEAGEVVGQEITPSVINSDIALSYSDADRAIEDAGHPWHSMLAPLDTLSRALGRIRVEAGAVTLDRPEMQIRVSTPDDVEVTVVPRSSPSRNMVSELMILCNSLLAEYCRDRSIPAPYRTQTVPEFEDEVTAIPDGPLRWYLMMRRLPPANLRTEPGPHGGLGVPAYIQATSPLRRYPDLFMQRQISHFLKTEEHLFSTEEVASVAQRADVQIRELNSIEEQRRRYWFLKYLKQKYLDGGADTDEEPFEAVVLENQPNRPGSLELVRFPFRVRAALPGGVDPGEKVMLQLHGVDLWRRVAQFVHVPAD